MITISIGIPAYNEEENIGRLLQSIIEQKESNYILKEIIVISDCSSDNTIGEVKKIKDRRITVVSNKTRIGTSQNQNIIAKKFKGDVLVILNADILLEGKTLLSKLIEPFYRDQEIGIVTPAVVPLKAKTFFEKILNFSVDFKKSLFYSWNNGNNIFMCVGVARAINKNLAKKIEWPKSAAEDAYSYLFCIHNNFKFVYYPKPKVFYKSPENFVDHKKQSMRFFSNEGDLKKYFPSDLVTNSYRIPLDLKIKESLRFFIKNPFMFISYVFILLNVKLNSKNQEFTENTWSISSSTKNLKEYAK